jgi:hypothetical protein
MVSSITPLKELALSIGFGKVSMSGMASRYGVMTTLGEGGILRREEVYAPVDQRILGDGSIPSLSYLALIQGKDIRCMSSCIFTTVPGSRGLKKS